MIITPFVTRTILVSVLPTQVLRFPVSVIMKKMTAHMKFRYCIIWKSSVVG